MQTKEFIHILENNPNQPLFFEYSPNAYVRMDYHITEVKNVNFDTVDCGGVPNHWQEVHVQLWESATPELQHQVDTTKALKIFKAVEKVRPTWAEVDIKFEYGNSLFHVAVLPVSAVDMQDGKVIVRLGNDQTSCKAKERATTPEEAASACCAPLKVAGIEKPKINLKKLVISGGDSCTPGGGCC